MKRGFTFGDWSPAQVKTLKEMWWQHYTPTAISHVLHLPNARIVAEKAIREGFKRDPILTALRVETGRSATTLKTRRGEPKPARKLDGTPITFADAGGHHCRWMTAEPPLPSSPICGHFAPKGSPWCVYHKERAYV